MDLPFNEDEQADAFFAALLTAVDEQLASKETPYVAATHKRLLKAGLSDDEAREEIAKCLAEESDRMLRSGRPFDSRSYQERLSSIETP